MPANQNRSNWSCLSHGNAHLRNATRRSISPPNNKTSGPASELEAKMGDLSGFVLSFGSPATLKSTGVWMIIVGLAAEAIVIFAIPSGTFEKSASVVCTVVIALGVWVEHVGSHALEMPRNELIEPAKVREEIVAKLHPFAGTKYDLGHPQIAREVWNFMWQFEPVLAKAGWIQMDWIGGVRFQKQGDWPKDPATGQKYWYGEANVSNVSIEVRPAYWDKLMPAASALTDALHAIGITARYDNNNTSQNDDAIHILVGPKE
jgi:hypothetical protein